ncbi:WxL domain-containing protein [Vagococcus sp. BWB3-3]|uniref:WxL domain-containing protein n=1 Tax=Vagococcus allomyrinae TaxID=2794353 RepID=A0A940SUJ6_9ENTE|nr:WxL domain-containing protein [Vagococcus allomyrinae]MBP1039418.1 WxL domain-containing protein [Vagococcus allomyrinae]
MKKINTTTVLCALALSAVVAPSVSSAANQSVNGDAKVEFKAGVNTPVNPVDPEDKEPKPVDPTEPDTEKPVVYPGGALRINHIPTISFGVNEISAKQADYFAQFEKVKDLESGTVKEKASYVEVADESGEFKGWAVKVSSDGVFRSAKGNIDGTITLSSAALRGLNGMDGQVDKAPVANGTVIVGKDAPTAEVLKAEAGKGYNTWQVVYGNSVTGNTVKGSDDTIRNAAVKLTVPEGQAVYAGEEYTASLVWTLEQGL